MSQAVMSTNAPSSPLGPARKPGASGSRTAPKALTTARAATVAPLPSRTASDPTPPFVPEAKPKSLPTVAPVPAPTHPSATGADDASRQAA